MKSVITAILTDTSVRTPAAIETKMVQTINEAAEPWFNAPAAD